MRRSPPRRAPLRRSRRAEGKAVAEATRPGFVTKPEQKRLIWVGLRALIVTQGSGARANAGAPFFNDRGFSTMKMIVKVAGLACLASLAACNQTATENKADNVEAATENQADMLDQQAANASSDAAEDRIENQADQVRQEGENKAEAIREAGENAAENHN